MLLGRSSTDSQANSSASFEHTPLNSDSGNSAAQAGTFQPPSNDTKIDGLPDVCIHDIYKLLSSKDQANGIRIYKNFNLALEDRRKEHAEGSSLAKKSQGMVAKLLQQRRTDEEKKGVFDNLIPMFNQAKPLTHKAEIFEQVERCFRELTSDQRAGNIASLFGLLSCFDIPKNHNQGMWAAITKVRLQCLLFTHLSAMSPEQKEEFAFGDLPMEAQRAKAFSALIEKLPEFPEDERLSTFNEIIKQVKSTCTEQGLEAILIALSFAIDTLPMDQRATAFRNVLSEAKSLSGERKIRALMTLRNQISELPKDQQRTCKWEIDRVQNPPLQNPPPDRRIFGKEIPIDNFAHIKNFANLKHFLPNQPDSYASINATHDHLMSSHRDKSSPPEILERIKTLIDTSHMAEVKELPSHLTSLLEPIKAQEATTTTENVEEKPQQKNKKEKSEEKQNTAPEPQPESAQGNFNSEHNVNKPKTTAPVSAPIEKSEDESPLSYFTAMGGKYFYGDAYKQGKPPAFEAKDTAITTQSNDELVVKAMVVVAKGKGWNPIEVNGSETFINLVKQHAKKLGLNVHDKLSAKLKKNVPTAPAPKLANPPSGNCITPAQNKKSAVILSPEQGARVALKVEAARKAFSNNDERVLQQRHNEWKDKEDSVRKKAVEEVLAEDKFSRQKAESSNPAVTKRSTARSNPANIIESESQKLTQLSTASGHATCFDYDSGFSHQHRANFKVQNEQFKDSDNAYNDGEYTSIQQFMSVQMYRAMGMEDAAREAKLEHDIEKQKEISKKWKSKLDEDKWPNKLMADTLYTAVSSKFNDPRNKNLLDTLLLTEGTKIIAAFAKNRIYGVHQTTNTEQGRQSIQDESLKKNTPRKPLNLLGETLQIFRDEKLKSLRPEIRQQLEKKRTQFNPQVFDL